MARPRTKISGTLTALPILLSPDSGTGDCVFNVDPKYGMTTGHIVLFKRTRTVHVTMQIQVAGYRFDHHNPIVVSDTLANKGVTGHTPANFTNITLSMGDMQLDFDIDNSGHKHFYYTLNFLDPLNQAFSVDPIIVNN
ncbi:MAG TPA: hypothetical protein VMT68_16400 [Caulobacteraceae bacterium]|nr:hypothetical protein [Caulobacteraceae bacterium]